MSCPMCEKSGSAKIAGFTEEEKMNGIRIALAGQPNSGKTTAFNKYTGEMSDVAESADFNMGIPIPSVGMKVKF